MGGTVVANWVCSHNPWVLHIVYHLLSKWCLQIWSTGDPSAADSIMADDVRFVDLLFEQETNSREEFKKMINSVFKVSFQSTLHVMMTELQSV